MSSLPGENESGREEVESTKLWLSCVGPLIGLNEGRDGNWNVAEDPNAEDKRRQRRRDVIQIENVHTEYAKHWRPGALLDAISDLDMVPPSEISRIREDLNKNYPAPVSTTISAKPAPGQRQQQNGIDQRRVVNPVPPSSSLASAASSVSSPPAANGGGPRFRFYPPRALPQVQVLSSNDVRVRSSSTVSEAAFKRPVPTPEPTRSNSNPLYSSVIPSVPSAAKRATIEATAPFVNNSNHTSTSASNGSGSYSSSSVEEPANTSAFRSALDQMKIDDKKKGIHRNYNFGAGQGTNNGLGGHRVGLSKTNRAQSSAIINNQKHSDSDNEPENPELEEIMSHESMKNIDRKMVEAVLNEVVQITTTEWEDIAGLEQVKKTIWEIIIWPIMRPDLFSGLRSAPKGILFFGPPGTGKTMFGRMIATKSNSTFFNISASSLTSKWIGEGEKMVRALFAVARVKQPSVIFIDEIDSILTQRSDTEHESSRRLKTEFLIQFDGCATQNEDRILVIGVTNRPQELDEAARRRLAKRIYIPLPDPAGRKQILKNLMKKLTVDISEEDYDSITEKSEGYSGADVTHLCKEASYGPLRDIPYDQLQNISVSQVRPIQLNDFVNALKNVKSSVATRDIETYEEWNSKFGCHS